MNELALRPARPLPAAAVAFALGVAGDLLIRATPWGVNVVLGTALVIGAVIFLMRRERPQPIGTIVFAAAGALLAASFITWRDSGTLVALDVLLALLFLLFLSLGARGVEIARAGIARIGAALGFTGVLALPGMFQLLLSDIQWRTLRPGGIGRRTLVVLRGIAIAVPMLLIFGGLLSSADAAFSALLSNIFNFDMPELFGHILRTIFLTFLAAGFLRATLWGPALPDIHRPAFFRLGAVETNIAIGLVDVLFAAFVAVQFRYFFGGAALVRLAPKLTYAEYARHGFFELVTVAALVVPMLLFASWIIDESGIRTFRVLALLQVLCVGVMLISAWRRMQLYVDEFGLTELRLYTTAFMIWIAALLLWFVATVLTRNRARFFIGALASGVAIVVALHFVNPDERIVRTNLERAAAGKRAIDMRYATSLSADAVPSLISALPNLPPCAARRLLNADAERGDWRSWNGSRARAHDAIDGRRGELVTLAAKCQPSVRH